MRLPINGQVNDVTANPVNVHEIRCFFRLNSDTLSGSEISKYLRLIRPYDDGHYHGVTADLDNLNAAHAIGRCDGVVLEYASFRERGCIALGAIRSGGDRRLRF